MITMTEIGSQLCTPPLCFAMLCDALQYMSLDLVSAFRHKVYTSMADNSSSYYDCSQPPNRIYPYPDISGLGVSLCESRSSELSC
jgi:hypothetical protein